jgi:LysR family transcriptional regulator, chromosome initiation inhibitor
MFPDSLAAPHEADGSFVRITDVHLDVPLYWQCWKLDSSVITSVSTAVRSAAEQLHQ